MKKVVIFLIPTCLFLAAFTVNDFQDPWKAPESAKSIQNPVADGKKIISGKKGKKVFQSNCIVCHGDAGKGDGPGGKALNPKPADLTSDKVQAQTDGEIFWKITNGRGAMVKWEPVISEAQRWDLVNYIRSLKN
ncbi:MAG: cytochrome c [Flavobacteriaceae bacterium]|nr:cytochrome c [Flavobacteriaceae bacterium]